MSPSSTNVELCQLTFLLRVGKWDRREVWVWRLLLLHWYKLIERETSDGEGFKYWTVSDPMHWRGDKPEAYRSFRPVAMSGAVLIL